MDVYVGNLAEATIDLSGSSYYPLMAVTNALKAPVHFKNGELAAEKSDSLKSLSKIS